MKLFGLAGTAGSGKDTVADLLTELFGVHNFNTSDYVRAVTRFLFDLTPEFSPIRDQLFDVATILRELNQASIVRMGILQAEQRNFDKQLISGLRTVGEADAVRQAGGIIIGVDANPEIRYNRIQTRVRDTESQRTYDEFLHQDSHENEGVEKSGPMKGIRYIIDGADIVIKNEGSLEDLKDQIIKKIGSKI